MPSYTSRRRKSIQRNAARIKKSISRDRRAVMHWAARGTKADHQKLRDHAKKVQHRVPSYIDQKVVDSIAEQGSRRHLAENAHDGTFLDGLAWVVDQIPGTGWTWIKQAVQGAMKPFRGDSITEEDGDLVFRAGLGIAVVRQRAFASDTERQAFLELSRELVRAPR